MSGDVLSGFSMEAQKLLALAQREARARHHAQVIPAHLLWVLVKQVRGEAAEVLTAAGADVELILDGAEVRLVKTEPTPNATTRLSKSTLAILSQALEEARNLKADRADAPHLLLSLAGSRSPVNEVLARGGATRPRLLEAVRSRLEGSTGGAETGAGRTRSRGAGAAARGSAAANGDEDLLQKYGRDITSLAEEGSLDPVVGRDAELRRAVQVLCRRTKNNPVLVGEPGVGKTALVEGLAQMVAEGAVPKSLQKMRIVNLDLGAIIAGAKFRGEFEERLRGVLEQVRESRGAILLFIDEIHSLVGAGQSSGGGLDAANLLKPALARGELRCIGATTREEYRAYLEKDKALERRFQPIYVEEPDDLDALAILKGVRRRYEIHHGVRIHDEALSAAVRLSRRYVADRCLPDKAIDVLDEAASRLRVELDGMPDEIVDLDVERARLNIVMESSASDLETKAAREEQAALVRKREDMVERWNKEVELIQAAQKVRDRIQQLEKRRHKALSSGELEEAAELQHGELPKAQKDLDEVEVKLSDPSLEPRLLSDLVTASEVAQVVATWTGVPVDDMLASERERLKCMEAILERRVKGQPKGIQKLSAAIRRARVGLKDPRRPIGSFLFLGPTGVGKTELAKALAEFLFHDETAIVRLDMSEFMEKQAASRLVGAAPGYVGYESGGQLTEAVRRRPYSLVLFDEVEKAHVEVFDLLLQVLDDGRLTDSSGRTVDMSNTVIVMTSNAGARHILDAAGDEDSIEEVVKSELMGYFRPEFLNRIDETIIFKPLGKDQLREIAGLMVGHVQGLLREKGFELRVTDALLEALVEAGWDPAFGARPLRRAVGRLLTDPLALFLLEQDPDSGVCLSVDWAPPGEGDAEAGLVVEIVGKTGGKTAGEEKLEEEKAEKEKAEEEKAEKGRSQEKRDDGEKGGGGHFGDRAQT